MISVFAKILDISISAGIFSAVIIILRLLLKKSPRWITLVLWALVGIKLICPIDFESPYSLQPERQEAVYSVSTPSGDVESITLPLQLPPPDNFTHNATRLEVPSLFALLSIVWIIGLVIMILYAVISYVKLIGLTRSAVEQNGVYVIKNLSTPFVFGIIKPRIYIPSDYDENILQHVTAHERMHIAHLDYIWKPLGFIILSLHWFNPLIWVSYLLFCRDIEVACDQSTVKNMSSKEKADYAQVLLNCTTGRNYISVCPVAFGENGLKERIKAVLKYKKPTIWAITIAVVLCVIVAFLFITERKNEAEAPTDNDITTSKDDGFSDFITVTPNEMSELQEDTEYRFPGIHETAISYALDIGYDISVKHYKSGAAFGKVEKINPATTLKVKANEVVELYYMEYYYFEGTISPSEDDKKTIYSVFFALHHNLKTDEWTRIGTIFDYHMKEIYKTQEMIDIYGDEFTAAAAETYKSYYNVDMGEDEQIILAAYKSATMAASWFRMGSILEQEDEYPTASDPYLEIDGRRYFKVKRFASYNEFEEYLGHLFSEKLVKEFLNSQSIHYINHNGELYSTLGIRGTNIHVGQEYYHIEKISDSKYVVKVTVDILGGDDAVTIIGNEVFEFPYEYVGDRWVFTEFPEIR